MRIGVTKKKTSSLVPHASWIWNGTVIFLIALVIVVLAFDGYVFQVRIKRLEQIDASPDVNHSLEGVKRSLLTEARTILENRKNALDRAGDNVPQESPFGR